MNFAVSTGGGSLAGAATTTGADGVASAGTWTLGTAAGPNAVTATVSGLAPVEFSATGTAGAPTEVSKIAGDPQNGTVGTTLFQPFVVRVTDAHQNPVSGSPVTFTVTTGGGTLSTASATTDAQGQASTILTLGRQPGVNTVTAAVAGVPAVSFAATARVGAAASIAKQAGDGQTAPAGAAVPIPPRVQVNDALGNPVPGVTVTFAVISGGGSVTGAIATTGADGRAAAGSWTLGTLGTNTLGASASGLPPAVFTATATDQSPCSVAAPFMPRVAVTGTLSVTDCRLSTGEYLDFFSTTFSAARAEEFLLTSSAFDTFLTLADASGRVVAANDDTGESTNSSIRVFAPAGQYFLAVSSFNAGATGSYQLSSRAMTAPTTCIVGWIVPGVTVNDALQSAGCAFSDGTLADVYEVYLRAGQRLTITQQSSSFDSYLMLVNQTENVVAEDDDSAGGANSRIVYTAPAEGVYAIYATSFNPRETGNYSLTVTTP